jgi:mRNA-degrading endonuclease toxin of MazEF toxin-antitoxin module
MKKMKQVIKNFKSWFGIKPKLDKQTKFPRFEEGQVWWCHLGENIGHEENGKGDKFLRPVIIIRKFNNRLFYGVPTSTAVKNNKYYFDIKIKDKDISVLLSQMKAIDVRRLSYKQSRISDNELLKLKKAMTKIILGKN